MSLLKTVRAPGALPHFLRFAAVGVANTLVDLGVFVLLYEVLRIPLVPAHLASYVAAVINSYVMNSLFTFRTAEPQLWRLSRVLRFLVISTLAAGLSSVAIVVFAGYLPAILAKISTVVVTMFVSFFGYKLFVFRDEKV